MNLCAKIALASIEGVFYMSNSTLQKAMKNAEASINMEGLYVSDSCKKLCEKLLNKEITFDEYIKLVVSGETAYGV